VIGRPTAAFDSESSGRYTAAVPGNVIQQLPPGLINRIAAGEVIERPASVVKELVENAIDAGATHISVDIEDGGRALIRIVDDGCGISVDDLPLAFASHATSKLHCDDDLFRIATMGFRGEALASIGAVAQARILSRPADQSVAYEIKNEGGLISDAQAAAGNAGTTIEVRNLFFNVPARRKFLKGASTEIGHLQDALLRLALPNPQIAFRLTHNGRTTMNFPVATPQQRWLAAWPDAFADAHLRLDVRDAEVSLTGLIGLPELAGPTAKHQYLFLNGRPIRDRFIQHGLREAYRGLTEPGRQPAAILLLVLPPQDVDVNVHPTKTEVRFRDSQRVHGLVQASIREVLLGSDLTPRAQPHQAADQPHVDLRTRLAEFFRSGAASASPSAAETTHDQPLIPSFPSAPPATTAPANAFSAPPASAASTLHSVMPAGIPAIQLHNSYLVAESEDGLVIIDQHALHERIMYEDLLNRLSRGPLESQRLLIPITVAATPGQQELLSQIEPLLGRLGIETGSLGPDGVAIHAFPSFLQRLDPGEFVSELLDRGEQEMLDLHQEELLHEILDMMACKAAVKAGDPLSPPEIEALLARRHLIDRSSNCPHGRPTTLSLSLRDLEKQFKRTGF